MGWFRGLLSPSNVWAVFQFCFPVAAAVVSGWASRLWQFPPSVTALIALMTAACVIILFDFVRSWFDRKNALVQRIAELEGAADRRAEKREILDEIGELRVQLVVLFNDMLKEDALRTSPEEWDRRFHKLEAAIGKKIEQFSGKASAKLFMNRGIIGRHFGKGLPPHQLTIDIVRFDLEQLRTFIVRNETA
jgi:hypothetical protein